MGDGVKRLSPSESVNLNVIRKSIVAKCTIKKGEILSSENITVKRPAGGMNPMMWDDVVGSIATKDYEVDAFI